MELLHGNIIRRPVPLHKTTVLDHHLAHNLLKSKDVNKSIHPKSDPLRDANEINSLRDSSELCPIFVQYTGMDGSGYLLTQLPEHAASSLERRGESGRPHGRGLIGGDLYGSATQGNHEGSAFVSHLVDDQTDHVQYACVTGWSSKRSV
jgi:hypothetical protein